MPKMSEAEENNLRVLFARFREEQPQAFIALVLQTVLNRMDDDSIVALRHTDNDEKPDGVIVLFKGPKYVPHADRLIADMTKAFDMEEDGLG